MEGRPTVIQLPEMLGEIFGWSKVLFDNELEAAANFLAFSQVCYTWRSTVHAMPRLWQVVSLGYWLVYDPNNDADPLTFTQLPTRHPTCSSLATARCPDCTRRPRKHSLERLHLDHYTRAR